MSGHEGGSGIVRGGTYRVRGNSEYMLRKYGTCNPVIRLEDRDTVIWPDGGWGE